MEKTRPAVPQQTGREFSATRREDGNTHVRWVGGLRSALSHYTEFEYPRVERTSRASGGWSSKLPLPNSRTADAIATISPS